MRITSHSQFSDLLILENFCSYDIRGEFVKIFNEDVFEELDIDPHMVEVYYSVSKKGVIRGMHFQEPPMAHNKIVHVIRGGVIDVVLDLRKGSPNYNKVVSVQLTGNRPKSLYIPKGFAHGFKCLENNTIMMYLCSTVYSPSHDKGVRFDSIPYDWDCEDPIVSERDMMLPVLSEIETPFV